MSRKSSVQAQRRGRRPALSDEVLLIRIREVLSEAEALGFRGEGYRKVWARLRHRGVPVSKERVRRLMREHGLRTGWVASEDRGSMTGRSSRRVRTGCGAPTPPICLWRRRREFYAEQCPGIRGFYTVR